MASATRPLVSVVTPVLNPGMRLLRCLESVAAQTYPDIEQVVVDGGSTDGTRELVASFDRVRWISNPGRKQAAAINDGLDLATGSVLTWLNADDTLMSDTVERAVATLARQPPVGLVYGDCRIVENDREVLTWHAPRALTAGGIVRGCSIPQPGAFFTRWAIERAGNLDESFELAMDVDLWLRLLAAGVESRRIAGVVSVFEIHSGSKSGSRPRQEFYEETSRALALAGLPDDAAIALGQGAAVAAARDGRVPREELSAQVRAVASTAGSLQPDGERTMRAAALAEAGVIELRQSLAGFRYLAAPEVWRHRALRRRIAAAARRGAPRVVRRVLGGLSSGRSSVRPKQL